MTRFVARRLFAPALVIALAILVKGYVGPGDGFAAGIVAALAFAYSLFAIGGAGAEVVYWGFLLLIAGLPVYVWVVRS